MATLDERQNAIFSARVKLPETPSVETLRESPAALARHLVLLNRALQDMQETLSERLQGYLLLPMETAEFGVVDVDVDVVLAQPEKDVSYQPIFTPSWNAAIWYTDLTTTGFKINASVAPGGSGGEVKWTIAR